MLSLVTLVLFVAVDPLADPTPTPTPRKSNVLAPSLPELTEAEETALDELIDRFIEADTGRLKGAEAKEALAAFRKLGPDATFALIRGMNKAAAIEHSCPALVIARKLNHILLATRDSALLQYARENIGQGVGRSRHMPILRDLKIACSRRQTTLEASKPLIDLRDVPLP